MVNLLRVTYLQAFWYLFIHFGELSFSWLYPLVALALVLLDKYFFEKNIPFKRVYLTSLCLVIIGLILDGILLNTGVVGFSNWSRPFSPPFLISIWIIFTPYYFFAFPKFKEKYYLAAILGGVFAPFSYMGGAKIGPIIFTHPQSGIYIGLLWAIFFPITLFIYNKKIEKLH